MVAFFVLRVITIALAFMHPDRPWLVVLVSLGQFVIMPYSFFSSVVGLITMIPPLFLGHVMIFGGLQFMLNRLPVELPSYAFLTIDARFIGIFFLLDQAACWVCVWLPGFDKKAEPLPWKSIFTSVVYGAFNCKSYFLVLLLLMQGVSPRLLSVPVFFPVCACVWWGGRASARRVRVCVFRAWRRR